MRPHDELDERFAAWVDGRMTPAEAEALERELAVDPELAAHADRYREFVLAVRAPVAEPKAPAGFAAAVLAALPPQGGAPGGDRPPFRILPYLASGVAAAAMVSLLLLVGHMQSKVPAASSETSAKLDDQAYKDLASAEVNFRTVPRAKREELERSVTDQSATEQQDKSSGNAASARDVSRGFVTPAAPVLGKDVDADAKAGEDAQSRRDLGASRPPGAPAGAGGGGTGAPNRAELALRFGSDSKPEAGAPAKEQSELGAAEPTEEVRMQQAKVADSLAQDFGEMLLTVTLPPAVTFADELRKAEAGGEKGKAKDDREAKQRGGRARPTGVVAPQQDGAQWLAARLSDMSVNGNRLPALVESVTPGTASAPTLLEVQAGLTGADPILRVRGDVEQVREVVRTVRSLTEEARGTIAFGRVAARPAAPAPSAADAEVQASAPTRADLPAMKAASRPTDLMTVWIRVLFGK